MHYSPWHHKSWTQLSDHTTIYLSTQAPVIIEAGKSQDLEGELASWRPRKVSGLVLVQRANDSAQV